MKLFLDSNQADLKQKIRTLEREVETLKEKYDEHRKYSSVIAGMVSDILKDLDKIKIVLKSHKNGSDS